MFKRLLQSASLAGLVAGAVNIATPAAAAVVWSPAAQVDAIDIGADFYVKLKSGVRCAARADGYFYVPSDQTTSQKLNSILTAAERLYIVVFNYDTANCRVIRVGVCTRAAGTC